MDSLTPGRRLWDQRIHLRRCPSSSQPPTPRPPSPPSLLPAPPLPLFTAAGCPWPPRGAVTHRRGAPAGEKMGLCARGLHRLARFCPGGCTPLLTFLDHGLVQQAPSRVIHGLRRAETVVVRALADLVSCRFPSPARPGPCPACSGHRARRSGGLGWGQDSPRLGTICAAHLGPGYPPRRCRQGVLNRGEMLNLCLSSL